MLTVIASMEQELAGLRRQLSRGWKPGGSSSLPDQKGFLSLDLQVVGIGKQAALRLRSQLQPKLLQSNGQTGRHLHQPRGLLMLGFAGAVAPGLETGDIVLSSRYYRLRPDENHHFVPLRNEPQSSVVRDEVRPIVVDSWVAAKEFLAPAPQLWQCAVAAVRTMDKRVVFADSLTSNDLVTTPAAKQAIGRRYPASSVNMEDYWVASVAQDAGVPFVSARVILDPAHQALPGYLLRMAGSRTKALLSLVATPWRIPTLLGLARQVWIAQRVLTSFAMNFLTQVSKTKPIPYYDAAHSGLSATSRSIPR